VRAGIERFRDSGVDEFAAAPFGTADDMLRTCEMLGQLAAESS